MHTHGCSNDFFSLCFSYSNLTVYPKKKTVCCMLEWQSACLFYINSRKFDAKGTVKWSLLSLNHLTRISSTTQMAAGWGKYFLHHKHHLCIHAFSEVTREILDGIIWNFNLGKRIYLLNHYSAGVIVFGARSARSNHSLSKVNIVNSYKWKRTKLK